ncbi:MAG TPA: dehydrogenase [Desulfotomaculum sp.]|nr:dehydrogenase [Desulfotomaculum sp.]HBY05109.1 dehydrogenase [Desulfotomaculum sp.]
MVVLIQDLQLQEALEIRSLKNTIVFAGGSDVMVRYRAWCGTAADFPEDVIFIGHLEELQGISLDNNAIRIGASATFTQILEDKRIPSFIKLPVSQIGSPSIRNIGTIGGNICNSSPAGDTLPMLYALDAKVTVVSKNSTYTIGINEFITGPGENILKQGEILKQITIPIGDYNRFYYRKVGQGRSNTISKTSFFALAKTDDTEIREVRIAFGAVATTVVRSPQSESYLKSIHKKELPNAIDKIKEQYGNLINPIDDLRSTKEYRKNVSLRMLKDFVLKELIK